ncbi:hypothetical protein Pmani_027978 [Petrolisthes manimaculis]|uniref:Uncharacterized protein n=1 Tax=Petrolisthes manimaculis TaxID=1843537 RepID=A0AAE1P0Z8_9EUCA|nr:hypothetical protein Pmani_027978 [Petrolisthes manimaculis]
MAKFRFPGKALKLNARKRVRFRGSYGANTPEELYTKKIRKGLDLFTQIYGDSDEDEDEFEGFTSIHPERTQKTVSPSGEQAAPDPDPPKGRGSKRQAAQRVEEACVALEDAGLVTRRRACAVDQALRELREGEGKTKEVSEGRKKDTNERKKEVCEGKKRDTGWTARTEMVVLAEGGGGLHESRTGGEVDPGSGKCVQESKAVVISSTKRVTQKRTNHRISRHPTVKTALAKKLLAKAKKKVPSLPVVGEKSPKRFILPTMSVRSSRIIKPNKRLFADFTDMFSSNVLGVGESSEVREDSLSLSSKRLEKLTQRGRGSHKQFLSLPRSRGPCKSQLGPGEGVGRDRMRRTISRYTEAITGPSKGQVGRPPKRRLEAPQQEVELEPPDSPQHCDPKESRVKEKIEKLLRSPWDNRLKQSVKGGKCEGDELMPAPASNTSPGLSASVLSRNILRKARLNLNKSTLQKIRNPASLQRLIPLCDEGSVEGKCSICDIAGGNTRKFNIVFCEVCSSFLSEASDGPKEIFECQRTKGECQIKGLYEDDRCAACWLFRILISCSMPSLLHDRLRKRLPPMLKDQIPTSLARSLNAGSVPPSLEKNDELSSHTKRLPLDPGGGGAFGSVMDLPGGWKRKTGPEIVVISPSGEKFKSVQKLEEFLKKQGINADARILFGNSMPTTERNMEGKSKPSQTTGSGAKGKVVLISLPGGWNRRIKWRLKGNKFDTYVDSPDGRTFRSRKELSAYFQMIGKVDDIHKYFPVVSGYSDASLPSSSETPGSSSTEPISSSELCSEASDKSPEASECEETGCFIPPAHLGRGKPKASVIKQLKMKSKKEKERNRSKSLGKIMILKNKSEAESENPDIPDPASMEVDSIEHKVQQQKAVHRTRSLSAGRKSKTDDASVTDTTESESEQKAAAVVTLFPKARGRPKKSKVLHCSPHLFGGKEIPPGHDKNSKPLHSSPPLFSGKENPPGPVVQDKNETPSSPNSFHDDKKVNDSYDSGNVGKSRDSKKVEEETVAHVATIGVKDDVSEKKDPKIVLKITKKALNIKPVKEKTKKKKKLYKEAASKSKNKTSLTLSKMQDSIEVDTGTNEPQCVPSSIIMPEETQGTLFGLISGESKPDGSSATSKEVLVTSKAMSPTQGTLFGQIAASSVDSKPDRLTTTTDVSVTSKATSSSNVSEGETKQEVMRAPDVKKPKPKKYSTYNFGIGWSRRVRWNEKGEGRITLVQSPDGQTFRSRIELLSYFKKAGNSRVNLDFYYPPLFKKPNDVLSVEGDKDSKIPSTESSTGTIATSTSAHSSDVSELSDSDAFIKTSEDSCISGDETRRPRISQVVRQFRKSITQPETRGMLESNVDESLLKTSIRNSGSCVEEGRKLVSLPSKGGRNIVVSIRDIKPMGKSESEEMETTLGEAGGPRVKHVCRSQAQVLGIPRAVFPSPKKEDRINGSSGHTVVKGKQKRKIVTVTTTASGKVLRKTQWCNKCPGCTTPNCLKCSNCLDMKKYGGPGTKKKPCVMRKCHNPRLAGKTTANHDNSKIIMTTTTPTTVTLTTTTTTTTTAVPLIKEPIRKVKVVTGKVLIEEKLPEPDNDTATKLVLQDKSVFIPRQMTRIQPDLKDRGDIAAGKQFVPGALVNIDYWQGYDADEMMLTGYPVTTASPLHPQVLCFRCGSVGKEQLLYCAWCCEGIHPYCLEDGEGPECEAEEVFWICRRCAVCHVCGAPGADTLLRCSDCRNYYHLECLGPLAHSTCQPTPDRPWEADLLALLGESWPHQPAIYDVRDFDCEGGKEDIVMHTELDALREDDGEDEAVPDLILLTPGESEAMPSEPTDLIDFTASMELEEDLEFDMLEDSICLEDCLVELFRDADLYKPKPSPTANLNGQEVVSMREDEYLYLGYKMMSEYPTKRIEMSYFRLLQIIHNEHFDTLGYLTWREMKAKGLVENRPSGSGSGSDTETASEGDSDSDDESDLDWEDIFEIRRHEAAQELKERESRRRERERKKAELEKEKIRLERQRELEKEAKEKERATQAQAADPDLASKKLGFRKKKRRGRPPGSLNKPKYGDEDFVVLDDGIDDVGDGNETPQRKKCRQPKSWEEFDKLFALLTCSPTNSEDRKIKSRRILHTDNGIIGRKPKRRVKLVGLKLKGKGEKLKPQVRKLKSLPGKNNLKVMKEKMKLLNGKKIVKSKGGVKKLMNVHHIKNKSVKRKLNVGNGHVDKKKYVVKNNVLKKRSNQGERIYPQGVKKRKRNIEKCITISDEDEDDNSIVSDASPSKYLKDCIDLASESDIEDENASSADENTEEINVCKISVSKSMKSNVERQLNADRRGTLQVCLARLTDPLVNQDNILIHEITEADLDDNSLGVEEITLGDEFPVPSSKRQKLSNKENALKFGTGAITNGFITSLRSSQEAAGTSSGNVNKRPCDGISNVTYGLPEKRTKRNIARASELASQRKAMLDY